MKKGYFSYSTHETYLVHLRFGNFANIVEKYGNDVKAVSEQIKFKVEESLNELHILISKMEKAQFWKDFLESVFDEVNWSELAEDAINNYNETINTKE